MAVILKKHLSLSAAYLLSATAWAQRASEQTLPNLIHRVDIRAFGDSGYLEFGENKPEPPADFLEKALAQVAKLRSADINFMNLEGSLVESCSEPADKPFSFIIKPRYLLNFVQWGINLVSLANNHGLDCQSPGTAKAIERAIHNIKRNHPGFAAHGISGSYRQLRRNPALMEIRGVRLGMVAIAAWEIGRRQAIGNLLGRQKIFESLQSSSVDIRILSLHGGIERDLLPQARIAEIAREFLAQFNGDIVFAHHPHRSQGIELVLKENGRYGVIFYSLGNFFHNGLSDSGDGLAAKVEVSKAGIDPQTLAVYPLLSAATKPRLALPRELAKIRARLLQSGRAALQLSPRPKGLDPVGFDLKILESSLPGFEVKVEKPRNALVKLPENRGSEAFPISTLDR